MKALTLWQPWASLLIAPPLPNGLRPKAHETRSWQTLHHGDFAVHAAKRWDAEISRYCAEIRRSCPEFFAHVFPDGVPPVGCVVGTAYMAGCMPTDGAEPDSMLDSEYGDWSPGRFAWSFLRPRRLERPVPAIGKQGVWALPPDVEAAVRAQFGEVSHAT